MREIAICDDDELQLQVAVEALGEFAQTRALDLHLSLYQSIDAMLAAIQSAAPENRPDVLFMDIEFDGEPAGIDAIGRVNELAPACQVVYLTNYLQYSLDIYQTNHAWYVLKSQFERRLPEIFQKLAAVEDERKALLTFTAKGDGRIVTIPSADVRYIERRDRATTIYGKNGVYRVRDKLSAVLAQLPQGGFARCHNSYAVNLAQVAEIRAADLVLQDGTCILVSRAYAKRFRERYLVWADSRTV